MPDDNGNFTKLAFEEPDAVLSDSWFDNRYSSDSNPGRQCSSNDERSFNFNRRKRIDESPIKVR